MVARAHSDHPDADAGEGTEAALQREMARRTAAPTGPPAPDSATMVVERFVAYTRPSATCLGSRALMALIGPVREDFRIVAADSLDRATLPVWLDGTPIVVDNRGDTRTVHRGTDAIAVVRDAYPSLPA
jgi:hypothetical protein